MFNVFCRMLLVSESVSSNGSGSKPNFQELAIQSVSWPAERQLQPQSPDGSWLAAELVGFSSITGAVYHYPPTTVFLLRGSAFKLSFLENVAFWQTAEVCSRSPDSLCFLQVWFEGISSLDRRFACITRTTGSWRQRSAGCSASSEWHSISGAKSEWKGLWNECRLQMTVHAG